MAAPHARNGARVASPLRFVTALLDPVDVATELPEPAFAVPVLVPPAFWLPGPLRPAGLPAPEFRYLTAPCGIVGSLSPVKSVTSHVLLRDGHLLGLPFAL